MLAYQQPLDKLGEAVRWFAAVPEVLMLHVTSSAELRTAALTRVLEGQSQPQNRSLFFVLESPVEQPEADWNARTQELHDNYAAAIEGAAAAQPPIPLPKPKPPARPPFGLQGFRDVLLSYASLKSAAFQGLVLVFAPAVVDDAGRFQSEMRALILDRSLPRVRFVVIEPEPASCAGLASELGAFAERVELRVADGALKRVLALQLAGMKTAPLGAGGQRLAGMAGPREAPPPRRGLAAPSVETATQELGSVGAPAAYGSPETMQSLRIDLMSASLALQTGKPAEAIQHQVQARDTARAAGLTREAALFELMLGGYLLQGGGTPQQAVEVFQRASQQAQAQGMVDLQAQAEMATGAALLSAGRPLEAAERYQKTGQTCELRALQRPAPVRSRASEPPPARGSAPPPARESSAPAQPPNEQRDKALAIECYRMSGQLLLGLGNVTGAQAAFQRALAVADTSPAAERLLTSAPESAKALAELYRKNGMNIQAESLEQQVRLWGEGLKNEPTAGDFSDSSGSTS